MPDASLVLRSDELYFQVKVFYHRKSRMSNPSYSRLIHRLSQAELQVTRRLVTLLAGRDCTVDEWRVMVLLADDQGHSMRDVSDFSLLPAANTTRLIDRMTSANLVHRRVDPDDRRRVLVFLTPRGRKRFEVLAPIVEDGYSDLSPGEAVDLEKMLTHVLAPLLEPQGTQPPSATRPPDRLSAPPSAPPRTALSGCLTP